MSTTDDRKKKAVSESDLPEIDLPHRSQADSLTPGAAEGDEETIEQDLEEQEDAGGPVE